MLQTRLSNELNVFVGTITAYATIAISWILVAGVYGMNVADMPELSWTYGHPAAIGLMLGLNVILWVLFRRNHWLSAVQRGRDIVARLLRPGRPHHIVPVRTGDGRARRTGPISGGCRADRGGGQRVPR